MEKNRKDLLNGTVVYFIGNAVVAILQLLMLKVITGNIPSEHYGYYNMIVSVDNLVTPVLTLQISDAVFRFIIKDNQDKKKSIYTNGFSILMIGIIVAALLSIIINHFFFAISELPLVVLYIASTNVFMYYQKMARALGNNHVYVIGSLLRAGAYLILQIIMIYAFSMKGESLFISAIASTFLCVIFLEIKLKCFSFLNLKSFDRSILNQMLKYSLPLVPNTVLWWMSSSLNQLIISSKISLDANGIYTAAGKFGSVITMVATVFNLAWQESAIKTYGDDESKSFYRDTYDTFFTGLITSIIVLIPIMFIVLPFLIEAEYSDAIRYAPILLIGTGIASMYGFLGQMYSAVGKTKGIMITTAVGVISNILIMFLTVNLLGLWSAAISMVISSFLIMVMRYVQFKEIMDLRISKKIIVLIIILLGVTLVYYVDSIVLNIVSFVISMIIFIILNKTLLLDLLKIVLRRQKK